MISTTLVACIGLPLVAGLHVFATQYGHHRQNRRGALTSAYRVTVLMAAIVVILAVTLGII